MSLIIKDGKGVFAHDKTRRKTNTYEKRQNRNNVAGAPYRRKTTSTAEVFKRYTPDEFYSSREWLELRYKALVKFGAKCQCCGRSRHDNIIIQVDHIKPRSLYPGMALDIDNLQVLCIECNVGKSNKDETDWR